MPTKHTPKYCLLIFFSILLVIALLLPSGPAFAQDPSPSSRQSAAVQAGLTPMAANLPWNGADSEAMATNLIMDGSFEAYVQGVGSPYWTETDSHWNSNTPLCNGDECGFWVEAHPYNGVAWAWFGGVAVPSHTASVSQTVPFPSCGTAKLQFYFYIGYAPSGSGTDDVFYVKVDGQTKFTANGTQKSSYASYRLITVDLNSLAKGTPHTISFSHSNKNQPVVFNLDDVSLYFETCPGTFGKSSPTNGATNQPSGLTLSWAASAGATSYEVCYDSTNDNACSNWVSTGTSTSKTLSGLSQQTTYYWHVRAKNSAGTTYSNGSATAFWSFKTGGPPIAFNKSAPANEAINQPTRLSLTWSASSNAIFYEYCFDTTNDNACSNWIANSTSTSALLSNLSKDTTYYWQVRAINSFGTTYANASETAFWSFTVTTNTDVTVGVEQASYFVEPHRRLRKSFSGWNSGPVEIASTDGTPRIASQRVLYGDVSYSEMMGLPSQQLSQEYLFPYYNNAAMSSQLRVSNLGGQLTTITVYLGTQQIDSFPLAAGSAERKSYPDANSGPLRVVSSSTDILTTIRVLYGSKSYSELMGLPVEALSQEYWYPVYDNVNVNSQLRVSNVGDAQTHITVYLAGDPNPIDEYDLLAGEASRRTYPHNSGPLHVVSSAEPILSTVRLLYNNNSYAEITGLPVEQLAQAALYPVYDNVSLGSELRVANAGANPTTITVFFKGVQIDSFELAAGSEVRKSYPKNNGPLQVVSSDEPIVSSIRHLYNTPTFSSFYELMGLPDSELSTQYYFPWYNNTAMQSELRFAVP